MRTFYTIMIVTGLLLGMAVRPALPPNDPVAQLQQAKTQYAEAYHRAAREVACDWALRGGCRRCHVD